jgi:hypothetical protein
VLVHEFKCVLPQPIVLILGWVLPEEDRFEFLKVGRAVALDAGLV